MHSAFFRLQLQILPADRLTGRWSRSLHSLGRIGLVLGGIEATEFRLDC